MGISGVVKQVLERRKAASMAIVPWTVVAMGVMRHAKLDIHPVLAADMIDH